MSLMFEQNNQQAESPDRNAQGSADSGANLSILVVDDDKVSCFAVISGLHGINPQMKIEEASSVAAAIDMLAKGSFDAVVSDWSMPDGGGGAIIGWMQARPQFHHVPFVMVSANKENTDFIDAFRKLGVDAYFVKPIRPKALYDIITAALKKKGSAANSTFQPELKPGPLGLTADRSFDGRSPSPPATTIPPPPSNEDVLIEGDAAGARVEALARIPGLDLDAGLRVVRNKLSMYTHMLELFAQGHGNDVERIGAVLDSGQLDEAQLLAHALEGSAGTLGAVRIQDIARSIGLPLKHQAPDALAKARSGLAELSVELPNFLAAIARKS